MNYFVRLFLVTLLSYSECYKILVVYPFPARSHNILGNGFVKRLLTAGHEVTYITPFPLRTPHSQLRQIDVSENALNGDPINIHSVSNKEQDLNDDTFLFTLFLDKVKKTLQYEHVQRFLSDPKEQFDLVVAEWAYNEVYSGLGVVFDCPFIWKLPYEPYVTTLRLVDEGPNPAYIPNLGSNNVAPFSFAQRVQELWSQLYTTYLKEFRFYYQEKEVYENAFASVAAKRGRRLPSYDDVRFNASLILSATHISLGESMRLPQNIKPIGGYHVDDEVTPLPDDLQKVMDTAKHGVIYFSMGSNLRSKDIADPIKKDITKMFAERKETVIWKFEEEFAGLPNNVHIVQWAPQQSILAHPNCKLFITHGGLLSTTETVHYGKPIIGIPIFNDQFNNVDKAVKKGYAKRVDFSFALGDDLRVAIEDILKDPKYSKKAEELSMIYHDRPVPPGRELVHWVEHVIKTRGAPHLRSPALHVPWYQKIYLDLAVFIILILILLKRVITLCFSCKVEKRSKKTN